jgi:PhzF family phenazine biosynthesis protein
MRLPMYQVDAFTDSLFGGNPAAVCPLDAWLPDATMQAIAAENNLAETAFFVRDGGDYALRWFTPTVEVDLCGHATLASGHVVFSFLEPKRDSVSFHTTKAGTLTVSRRGDMLVMDFPARPAEPREPPPGLLAALGGKRAKCWAPATVSLSTTPQRKWRRSSLILPRSAKSTAGRRS